MIQETALDESCDVPEKLSDLSETVAKRDDLMSALADADATKPELIDEYDVPRSTLDRAIRELRETGLVVRDGDRYELTTSGRLALDARERYVRLLTSVVDSSSVLDGLSNTADVPLEFLDEASVVEAEPPSFDQPTREFLRLADSADAGRGYLPYPEPSLVDAMNDRVGDGELRGTMLVASEIFDADGEFEGRWPAIFDDSAFEVRAADSGPEFGLWVLGEGRDRRVALVEFDEPGVAGVVVNGSDTAVRWAENTLESLVGEDELLTDADPSLSRTATD